MYSSQLFEEEEIICWEGKVDAYKTWRTFKSYLKDIYTKQMSYNKATGKFVFKGAENVMENNIVSEDIIRCMFEELRDT